MQRTYKFRLYLSKNQEKQMKEHLQIAKDLWNELLAYSKECYQKTRKFPSKFELQKQVKGKGLYSQTQQTIAHRVSNSIFKVFKLRKMGIRCGFPRFKSIDRVKSLLYPQSGFKLDQSLKVTPFGEISIKQHRKIEGKIKTLTLKKEPSGKWFAVFCIEREMKQKEPKSNLGDGIGLDLGLKVFAVLSNGEKINNPRHLKKYEDKLAFCQRLLSRRKKGSKNREKAKLKVARIHENISNARSDFLHKISKQLVNDHSFIALEKLASKKMSEKRFGKQINDAGWNAFANMLRYKAEEAGCRVIFVDPKNTTQECSSCHEIVKKDLSDRTHRCPSCGLVVDRDLNAAMNILNHGLRQLGRELPEIKPLREGTNTDINSHQQVPLMKEEAAP